MATLIRSSAVIGPISGIATLVLVFSRASEREEGKLTRGTVFNFSPLGRAASPTSVIPLSSRVNSVIPRVRTSPYSLVRATGVSVIGRFCTTKSPFKKVKL